MSNAIAAKLRTNQRDYEVPFGIKVLAGWALLRAIPIVGFALYLVLQTVENLSAAGIFGSLLALTVVLLLLGYAAFAGITAISLWNGSPNGIQGIVVLGTVGAITAFMFLGTQDAQWILGFTPELYPLAIAGLGESYLTVTFLLVELVSIAPIVYVFARRDSFK